MESTSTLRIQRSGERAFFDHEWLKTFHSLSFAEYYDPENTNWGALRVFNEDVVAADRGFGTHPHRDMEILTYVLEGQLAHSDSLGNRGIVGAGGVQYLSAGTGITHSEYNGSKTVPCHFVQMWVMPQAKGLAPRYGQVDFTENDRLNQWCRIASGRENIAAPIAIWQDATCSVARLENHELPLVLEPERYGFLFVASGEIRLHADGLDDVQLASGDAVRCIGPNELHLSGSAELIAWDVPRV